MLPLFFSNVKRSLLWSYVQYSTALAIAYNGGFRGGARGPGPPFFLANALAHGEGVAPCHVICACSCRSERSLYITQEAAREP